MPTISVDKAALFKELGREYGRPSQIVISIANSTSYDIRYTTEEFDELCFEFGMSGLLRE